MRLELAQFLIDVSISKVFFCQILKRAASERQTHFFPS